ncbi:TonB-dependent receptor [Flavobacterium sp. Arc2]|uniref:TonB-dependent receptor n=1 Tax=Flavobacterium sp. Arc2 TaxID=3046685 RepID=UPI00352C1D58
MSKVFMLVLLVLVYNIGFSQKTIQGKVSFGVVAEHGPATIVLKLNGAVVAYATTDSNDNYLLKTVRTGSFQLIVNSLNYKVQIVAVEILPETSKVEKDIQLVYSEIELKEVVIETVRPIIVDGDKIIYDAKSFAQGNEQVVEDLLKKIPGLNISTDGTIKVGNQEVEKVMIDGDDMFEKGYKILTKNMPVNPIDKIELLQRYSNNKHLKGIENSNKVALNLTLKEDFKRQWFGNMNLGYGLVSANRYEVRTNLMNFGKKNKYYFLANLNTIGVDATGDINELVRPYRFNEPGSIGDDQSAIALLEWGLDTPNLKQKRVSFNNAEMGSLNSIFTLSNKVKLKVIGFLNTDENDFFRNSFQSFAVGTTSFENSEDFVGRKKHSTGFGKADLIYDISATKTLEYTSKINSTTVQNTSDLLFNNDFIKENLNTTNTLFDQKMLYTNKFKKNKVLLFSGRYISDEAPQNYAVNQFLFQDLFAVNADNTKQYSKNKMQFVGLEAHLLDKKEKGSLLELKIKDQLRIDDLESRFELLDGSNSISAPQGYQNNIVYTSNDLSFSGKYSLKLNKFTLLLQSDFHQLFNQLKNDAVVSSQRPFYLVPKLGLELKINSKNKIVSSYSYTTTNAGVLDVYSGYLQTGFRSFSKGLEVFNQLNASNAVLNYSYGNWGDKFFSNTFLLYAKNNDFYSTNSFVSQNFSQSEKIIIKDRAFLSISSSVDRYFKPIKSNLKVNLGATKTNFKNSVNNSNLREVNNFSADYGFELRSGFKGFFNYHIGSKWNYNQVKTSTAIAFTDNMSFFDLSFMFSDTFNVQLQSERYFFGNLNKDSNKYYFLDLEARYVVKENKLTFFLSGNNLFNTQTFKNYSVSDISISKTEYRLVPRYVLLKMEYRF